MKRKTRIEIEALVDQIVADTLDVKKSELKADTHLRDDLAADSIDAVDVVMALEKEFDIDIPDPQWSHLHDCTMSEIYNLVETLHEARHE